MPTSPKPRIAITRRTGTQSQSRARIGSRYRTDENLPRPVVSWRLARTITPSSNGMIATTIARSRAISGGNPSAMTGAAARTYTSPPSAPGTRCRRTTRVEESGMGSAAASIAVGACVAAGWSTVMAGSVKLITRVRGWFGRSDCASNASPPSGVPSRTDRPGSGPARRVPADPGPLPLVDHLAQLRGELVGLAHLAVRPPHEGAVIAGERDRLGAELRRDRRCTATRERAAGRLAGRHHDARRRMTQRVEVWLVVRDVDHVPAEQRIGA